MTRLAYTKEEHCPSSSHNEATASGEAGQILHLKRLLVTLKQHYEKSLHLSEIQLQAEQNQRIALQKEVESLQILSGDNQKHHEEELQALRHQQNVLKELLKKTQDELKQFQSPPISSCPDLLISRQRVEQLERVIPYLRDRTEEAHLETEQLREEVVQARKRIKILEQEHIENQQKAQQELEHFQQLLEVQKKQDIPIETAILPTSSHHLRQELEEIRRSLSQGSQETKALESRYVEVLNEKIKLEHQCKQLQLQLEHQSSNLTSFQTQLHDLEQQKRDIETALKAKEIESTEGQKQRQEFQESIQYLDELTREKEYVQEKYEQLREEWVQLTERLEEAVEVRTQVEQHLAQLKLNVQEQDAELRTHTQHLLVLNQEKRALEQGHEQLRSLLEESESRLKVSQQHLAKKVKENALLTEKVEEQQIYLNDSLQTIELQKTQLVQLQVSLELYQKQEKRLQDQLHDALKGTESQVAKWEEKYFRMYDKWQESEERIQELKKFEEKHHQMQSLFANLGTFMGASFNPSSSPLFQPGQVPTEQPVPPVSFDSSLSGGPTSLVSKGEVQEKYDLFGMRQPMDKQKPNLFS